MDKRLGVLGVALALLALGVVSPALGSSGDDDARRTIRLVAINTEFNFLDLGAEGETLGTTSCSPTSSCGAESRSGT